MWWFQSHSHAHNSRVRRWRKYLSGGIILKLAIWRAWLDHRPKLDFKRLSTFFFPSLYPSHLHCKKQDETPFIFHFHSFPCDIMNIKKPEKGKAGRFLSVMECLFASVQQRLLKASCVFQANANNNMIKPGNVMILSNSSYHHRVRGVSTSLELQTSGLACVRPIILCTLALIVQSPEHKPRRATSRVSLGITGNSHTEGPRGGWKPPDLTDWQEVTGSDRKCRRFLRNEAASNVEKPLQPSTFWKKK